MFIVRRALSRIAYIAYIIRFTLIWWGKENAPVTYSEFLEIRFDAWNTRHERREIKRRNRALRRTYRRKSKHYLCVVPYVLKPELGGYVPRTYVKIIRVWERFSFFRVIHIGRKYLFVVTERWFA